MEKFYCGNCGYPNSIKNKFCNNCGDKLINDNATTKEIKSKKIKDFKLEETLPNNYQTLTQKLNELIKKSGFFTMYCGSRYLQYLKHETENKLYVAIIHIDNTEVEIVAELESLKFEPVEENLIRGFDIVSKQKTVSEVITVTRKIFEEIYRIGPSEPFFYEILEDEDLQSEKVVSNYTVAEKNETKSDNKKIAIFVIAVIILIAFYSHYRTTSNNDNRSTGNAASDSVKAGYEQFKASETTGKLVGVWMDEWLSSKLNNEGSDKFISDKVGYKFVIGKDNKLYVQTCILNEETLSKNATTILSPLASELRDDKTRYTDMDKPEQYYVIDRRSNDLLIYDNFGLIVRCKNLFIDYGDK